MPPYLNWRYIDPPHVRYSAVALKRHGEVHGYAVYRHLHEPLGRVTLIVDFLAHPDDISGLKTLLRWVDRAARAEDSDKVRCYTLNDSFRRVLRRQGYFGVKSSRRGGGEGERRAGAARVLRRDGELAHHLRRLRALRAEKG